LVARTCPDALFLDVAARRPTVIPIVAGRGSAVKGRTDPARVRSGELVYTGAAHAGLRDRALGTLGGRRCRSPPEHFAVTADVHRWLGRIDERELHLPRRRTARPEPARSRRRIARMVCGDLEMIGLGDVDAIAITSHRLRCGRSQRIRQVMRRLGPVCPGVAVLAGEGTFLARAAAEEVGLATRDLADDLGQLRRARHLPPQWRTCWLRWRTRHDDLGMNERSWILADRCIGAPAAELRVAAHTLASGARVLDAGAGVPGGFAAGLALAELCMGGLDMSRSRRSPSAARRGRASRCGPITPPSRAWHRSTPAGRSTPRAFFAMGSGPLRAKARVERELFGKTRLRGRRTARRARAGGPYASNR